MIETVFLSTPETGKAMGRHRKTATDEGNIKHPTQFTDTEKPIDTVDERLGLNDLVCASCDVKNPKSADKCRKCGSTQLRPRASQYRDE